MVIALRPGWTGSVNGPVNVTPALTAIASPPRARSMAACRSSPRFTLIVRAAAGETPAKRVRTLAAIAPAAINLTFAVI